MSEAGSDVPGLDAAAAELAGAKVVKLPTRAAKGKADAKPKEGGKGGGRAERSRYDPKDGTWQLPANCPVAALGTCDGTYFYLDAVGQLRALKARDHGNKDLLALFAPRTDWLHETFPRYNKDGEVTGWRPEEAGELLMNACAAMGVWNAVDKVRGRGTWLDSAGKLILHVGDEVLIDGEWRRTGPHDGYVYPAGPPVGRPVQGAAPAGAMDELVQILRSWSWGRPQLDPYLMLGFMGAAMLGGALEWRPLAWVTGDKGTGKSTLHRLIEGIMGGALLWTSDASEAGIRQTLGNQTLPVAIDEAEADDDNRKLQALVKLARQASSGGKIVRGGADHNAQSFVARSCFLLSSILIPPLQGQDRSRLAILELKPLDLSKPEPQLDGVKMRQLGAVMRRRLLDGWPRFNQTLRSYRDMLKAAGHVNRGADQFGTLLAVVDLLLEDRPPTEADLEPWAAMFSAAMLSETRNDVPDAERCLSHLLTSAVNLEGGSRPQTVGYWVGQAEEEMADLDSKRPAEKGLATLGLRVVKRKKDGTLWLAVASAHQGLARLFQNSHWQARSGAEGVWAQSLSRAPGALSGQNVRISRRQIKCTLLPLALCREEGEEADF